jgi:hypothetical protein
VTARELRTGKQAAVTIRPSGGLSDREIVEIIARRRAETPAPAAPGRTRAPTDGLIARVRTGDHSPPDDDEK